MGAEGVIFGLWKCDAKTEDYKDESVCFEANDSSVLLTMM